jgi:hypothetical protein
MTKSPKALSSPAAQGRWASWKSKPDNPEKAGAMTVDRV